MKGTTMSETETLTPPAPLDELARDALASSEELLQHFVSRTDGPVEALAAMMVTTKMLSVIAKEAGFDLRELAVHAKRISDAAEVQGALSELEDTLIGMADISSPGGDA